MCIVFCLFLLFLSLRLLFGDLVLNPLSFLVSDASANFYTVRKNSEAPNDDERRRLEAVGQFHLGAYANRFQRGSLVMKLPETENATLDTVLFGTVEGSIGVIASLPPAKCVFLSLFLVDL